MFTVELSFSNYFSWESVRSFNEFAILHNSLRSDPILSRHFDNRIGVKFPAGVDGIDDVMLLVERKESIDAYIKEIVSKIDYNCVPALRSFIRVDDGVLGKIERKVTQFQRRFRRFHSKKVFNMALFKFYSREINGFTYFLEEGMAVLEAGPEGVREKVMWLDVSDEAALSRICIASRRVFELPPEYEDDRLANGIFLADIGEVRSGQGTFGFKSCSTAGLDPAFCLSVVGSERTLDFQLRDGGEMARVSFIDNLRLLVLRCLTYDETRLRGKRWCRETVTVGRLRRGLPAFEQKRFSPQKLREAEMMRNLLVNSIQVEEEVYAPMKGLHIVSRLLKFVESENTLHVIPVQQGDEAAEAESTPATRFIDLDDVSEVRPGKMCSLIDGSNNLLMLTVVASETILCLPVASIALRNALINRFQSFFEVYRSPEPASVVFKKRASPIVAAPASSSSSWDVEHSQGLAVGSYSSSGSPSSAGSLSGTGAGLAGSFQAGSYSSRGGRSSVAVHMEDSSRTSLEHHGVLPTLFPWGNEDLIADEEGSSSPRSERVGDAEFDMMDLFEGGAGADADADADAVTSNMAQGSGRNPRKPAKRKSLTSYHLQESSQRSHHNGIAVAAPLRSISQVRRSITSASGRSSGHGQSFSSSSFQGISSSYQGVSSFS